MWFMTKEEKLRSWKDISHFSSAICWGYWAPPWFSSLQPLAWVPQIDQIAFLQKWLSLYRPVILGGHHLGSVSNDPGAAATIHIVSTSRLLCLWEIPVKWHGPCSFWERRWSKCMWTEIPGAKLSSWQYRTTVFELEVLWWSQLFLKPTTRQPSWPHRTWMVACVPTLALWLESGHDWLPLIGPYHTFFSYHFHFLSPCSVQKHLGACFVRVKEMAR